jgi:IS30 family transposase
MSSKPAIDERSQILFALLTKGMKGYEIAKELRVDSATISRDIKYLTEQSQNYLDSLAKEILRFMYQTSNEGIRDVIKECYVIYHSSDQRINMYRKLAALQSIKYVLDRLNAISYFILFRFLEMVITIIVNVTTIIILT